jgi:hypothetical protein
MGGFKKSLRNRKPPVSTPTTTAHKAILRSHLGFFDLPATPCEERSILNDAKSTFFVSIRRLSSKPVNPVFFKITVK